MLWSLPWSRSNREELLLQGKHAAVLLLGAQSRRDSSFHKAKRNICTLSPSISVYLARPHCGKTEVQWSMKRRRPTDTSQNVCSAARFTHYCRQKQSRYPCVFYKSNKTETDIMRWLIIYFNIEMLGESNYSKSLEGKIIK